MRLLFVLFVFLVLALFIDGEEAVELHDRAGGAEEISLARRDIDRRLIEDRRHHLRGDEALPDEAIERELIFVKITRERFGRARDGGRADRFVRVLRAFLRAIVDRPSPADSSARTAR